MTLRFRRQHAMGTALSALLILTVLPFLGPAAADTAPPVANDPTNPQTVSSDALPTVQIDGVVWDQAVVGNTVYVGGAFTTARPAGSAPGVNTVVRSNLLAYDITTGELIQSWAPLANAQVTVVEAAPDGSRIYVGGSFTTVNGVTRRRIAALNPTTGALINPFNPNPDASVSAIAATTSTVYFGGAFGTAGGAARSRLAAVSVAGGTLLPWAPTAAGGIVKAIALTPDDGRVIAAGQFTTMNGSSNPGYGLAAIHPVSGALVPWAANATVRNGGANAGFHSLSVDADSVYVSGFTFGSGGNLEGVARINLDGTVNWVEDCHGDTYATYSTGGVVYKVGHQHYCGNIPGGFHQSDPWMFRRAMAFTKVATGVARTEYLGYANWAGTRDPSILHWYPDLEAGTVTGQTQAAWTLTGNADYVVAGGEFPSAEGVPQQGLVRFARRAIAPNTTGPELKGSRSVPIVTLPGAGEALVSWQANWDRDNRDLTYRVYRDTTTQPAIYTTTRGSDELDRPFLSFLDTGLTPGTSVRYRIVATDPLGNQSLSDWVTVVVSDSGATDGYAKAVLQDGPESYWRLDESSGTDVADFTGRSPMTATANVTRGVVGAVTDHAAANLPSSGSPMAATAVAQPAPFWYSVEAWFQTTSTRGGRIVGFGNAATGSSTTNKADRQLYLSNSGQLNFGDRMGANRVLTSAASYNNGQWHHAVGTVDDNGMTLYVDGVRVGYRSDTRAGAAYTGYWRIGGDNLQQWANRPTSDYFNGGIDEVAVYRGALSANQVRKHYLAAGRTVAGGSVPTDAYGKAVYDAGPSFFWRLGETAGTTAADSSLNGSSGGYVNGTLLDAASAVGVADDRSVTTDGSNDGVALNATLPAAPVYSEELWFKTTTTQGGKLIGFGNARTGSSTTYDRHVYMTNAGNLVFGVRASGAAVTIQSPGAYNDGSWHHLVATQGPRGMSLYVDGLAVAAGPTVNAQDYVGYWRVGGDTLSTWPSRPTSDYFAGQIDEVAVYPRVLSADEVTSHVTLGGGVVPNQPPTAAFTSAGEMTLSFDSSASTDPDGTIVSRAWDFGDGQTSSAANPSHDYAGPGVYSVTLTVTDNSGASASVVHSVTATNPLPTAAFSSAVNHRDVTFDSSASSDPNGTIASYAWDFGDGQTGTTANPHHTYASFGSFQVVLTVTDNHGGTATLTRQVNLVNTTPTASFSSTVTGLVAAFDSAGSADVDGTIVSRSWDFGDGTTGTGVSPTHTYTRGVTVTVTLTVTDDQGATSTVSHPVTPDAGPPPTLAADTFERTATSGWGTADTGGLWTRTGSAGTYAVNAGNGVMTLATAGLGPTIRLDSVSATNTDSTLSLSFDKLADGGGLQATLGSRQLNSSGYRAKVKVGTDGRVTLSLVRTVTNVDTSLASVLLPATTTLTPGAQLRIRLQTEGTSPTTLRARAWLATGSEPATWQVTATDSTAALQAAGGVILTSYVSGSSTNVPIVARFDNLLVSALP